MTLLAAQGLVKEFGGFRAVDGGRISVDRGEIHAVIGPNGAGKTTFFYMLAGYLRPDAGSIRLEDREIAGLSPARIARRGLVCTFQATNLFARLTAAECVEVAVVARQRRHVRFWAPRGRRYRPEAMELLEAVGLQEAADAPAGALSHGDQRLLEVAVALAARPKILLLDEPTAGMSPLETERTVALLRRLAAQWEIAIVIVEHDVGVVFSISDRITVLHNGAVLTEGTPGAVEADPRVQEIYLGTPL